MRLEKYLRSLAKIIASNAGLRQIARGVLEERYATLATANSRTHKWLIEYAAQAPAPAPEKTPLVSVIMPTWNREDVIERAIETAGTAPSGANLQPWRFVVVRDAGIKRQIRIAAEREEYESYHGRMSEKWLRRLAVLGTDEHKPFLEIAPFLIVVFRLNSIVEDGESEPTYYSQESVGIAVGMLLAALHNAGLATLTHTPSPMKFLQEILRRPKNEIPFVLIPVGYPAAGAQVPDLLLRDGDVLDDRRAIHDVEEAIRKRQRAGLADEHGNVSVAQAAPLQRLRVDVGDVGVFRFDRRALEHRVDVRAGLRAEVEHACIRAQPEHLAEQGGALAARLRGEILEQL